MPRNEHLIPDSLTRENVIAAAAAYEAGVAHAFHDSTKFDVLIEGVRYPPKAILAFAAKQLGIELQPSDFTGGLGSKCFRILKSLGFDIVYKALQLLAHDFKVGAVYDRKKEIHSVFGGQQQGGISTPKDQSFIFLFSTDAGELWGYRDGWNEDGVFLYSGEGQAGDQEFTKGNKAILNHATDGKSLEVFESLGKGKGCRFLGSMSCSSHEIVEGQDSDGNKRSIIVFHLLPNEDIAEEDEQLPEVSLDVARQRALDAARASVSERTSARQKYYHRSAAVKQYVLQRARGRCELCGCPAPFTKKDGTPYLEPHHTQRISDSGPDHPRWVAALCPNCHREIHSGIEGESKNATLITKLEAIESTY